MRSCYIFCNKHFFKHFSSFSSIIFQIIIKTLFTKEILFVFLFFWIDVFFIFSYDSAPTNYFNIFNLFSNSNHYRSMSDTLRRWKDQKGCCSRYSSRLLPNSWTNTTNHLDVQILRLSACCNYRTPDIQCLLHCRESWCL